MFASFVYLVYNCTVSYTMKRGKQMGHKNAISKQDFSFGRKFLIALATNFFCFLTILFFSPSEVFLGNSTSFSFSYYSFAGILLLLCVGLAVGLSLLESIFSARVWRIPVLLAFSITLCCYLQSAFFNSHMGSLTGVKDEYSTSLIAINSVIWLVVIALVFIGVKVFQKKLGAPMVNNAIVCISVLLIVMQAVGLVTLLPRANDIKIETDANYEYISVANDLSLAKKNNAIVFILDTAASQFMEDALWRYPDLFDKLSGFTYYPNMTSTFSRTFPSVPYLLTKQFCYFDKPADQYVDDAFSKSSFLTDMYDRGCDIGLYTPQNKLGKSILPKLSNYGVQLDGVRLSNPALLESMLSISFYRNVPYIAKHFFLYDINNINARIVEIPSQYNFSDYEGSFYTRLIHNGININTAPSSFRFYHFFGPHPGSRLNVDATYANETTSTATAIRGDFTIIEAYISALKRANIYDSSTIIITTDHGFSGGYIDSLDLPATAAALLLVKPAGATASGYNVSIAPVCHEDLFATILQAVGLDGSSFGRTVYEISEDETRERLYYYSALFTDPDGEIVLREYAVNGDARNLESYQPTGNYWDINYSQNKVSPTRYADVMK